MSDLPVGILLAAGQSSRFGQNKLIHPLPDSRDPIAVQSARNLLNALPDSVAVVREHDHELKAMLAATGIRIVDNKNAVTGISSSIRCGINALQARSAGWVIALADMPYIPHTVILQVAETIQRGALICAPQYKGQRGHPVGFSIKMKNKLLELQGDLGARRLINKNIQHLKLITVEDKFILQDIDHLSDLLC